MIQCLMKKQDPKDLGKEKEKYVHLQIYRAWNGTQGTDNIACMRKTSHSLTFYLFLLFVEPFEPVGFILVNKKLNLKIMSLKQLT